MSETNNAASPSPDLPPLHELQRFETRRIARSQIKNAAYNPRKISKEARARLKELLKKFGLVESLVWNERTGNLVGGHQRLSLLDTLAYQTPGSVIPDYSLDVAVVNLDDAEEKALNAALNAKGAQGEYDARALAAVLEEIEGQIEIDLADLFSDEKDLQKLLRAGDIEPLDDEQECSSDKENAGSSQSMTLLFLDPADAKITMQAIERAKAEFALEGDKIDAIAVATICRNYLQA